MGLFGYNRNTTNLCLYHIFNYTAIGISASGLVTDMFLLNTGIDTVRFGTLKSHTFLLPAIFFLLISGFLSRLNKDQAVTAWCYITRCAVPALTTGAILLFSPSPEVIYYMITVMFIVSFTCAAVANNILTRILQQALPQEDFNRGCIFIPSLGGIFASIIVLGEVWLLEKTAHNRETFFITLFLLQFFFGLLEIPAYRAIMALNLNKNNRKKIPAKLFDLIGVRKVFTQKDLRFVLFYMLIRGAYAGMLGAYLGVFLIRTKQWRPFHIILIEISLTLMILLTSGSLGKIANRIGIPAFLGFTAAICAVINLLWGIGIYSRMTWIQWIFLILVYNGTNGVLTSGQYALESGATTLFAPTGRHELSIGWGALVRAIGGFAGSCIASWLFFQLPGNEAEKSQKFFMICSVIPFFLFLCYWAVYRTSRMQKRIVR